MIGQPTRVAFLIRHLDFGGAERQLLNLMRGLDKTRFDVWAVTFYDGGGLEQELDATSGVHRLSLHKRDRWDVLGFAWRLYRTLLHIRPDVLHGYMGPANLAALAGKLLRLRVVWGVRASNMDLRQYDWLPRLIFQAECALSRYPDLIIANSEAGMEYHVAHGFPRSKMRVIPNGIDTERFRPDPGARRRLRAEWGISDDQLVVGLVARLDPMKGHSVFLAAAALLAQKRHDLVFVCVGAGPEAFRLQLEKMAAELGIGPRVLWLGSRADMPEVYSAFDIACSSSIYGEGFSNAVAEAMACGVPCVVAATGDSARVVGSAGMVVEAGEPRDLADACDALLRRLPHDAAALSLASRAQIVEHFSVDRMVRLTQEALAAVAE